MPKCWTFISSLIQRRSFYAGLHGEGQEGQGQQDLGRPKQTHDGRIRGHCLRCHSSSDATTFLLLRRVRRRKEIQDLQGDLQTCQEGHRSRTGSPSGRKDVMRHGKLWRRKWKLQSGKERKLCIVEDGGAWKVAVLRLRVKELLLLCHRRWRHRCSGTSERSAVEGVNTRHRRPSHEVQAEAVCHVSGRVAGLVVGWLPRWWRRHLHKPENIRRKSQETTTLLQRSLSHFKHGEAGEWLWRRGRRRHFRRSWRSGRQKRQRSQIHRPRRYYSDLSLRSPQMGAWPTEDTQATQTSDSRRPHHRLLHQQVRSLLLWGWLYLFRLPGAERAHGWSRLPHGGVVTAEVKTRQGDLLTRHAACLRHQVRRLQPLRRLLARTDQARVQVLPWTQAGGNRRPWHRVQVRLANGNHNRQQRHTLPQGRISDSGETERLHDTRKNLRAHESLQSGYRCGPKDRIRGRPRRVRGVLRCRRQRRGRRQNGGNNREHSEQENDVILCPSVGQ